MTDINFCTSEEVIRKRDRKTKIRRYEVHCRAYEVIKADHRKAADN